MTIALPSFSDFRNPVLTVLGTLTDNQPGVFVPLTDKLFLMVYRAAGWNPKRLSLCGKPEDGWRIEGISGPPGFRRKVSIAYQDLHTRVKVPLTVKGNRGQWALTPSGVAQNQVLEEASRGKPNETALFIDRRLKETKGDFLRLLHRSVASKMLVSATSGMVEDHVQNCMVRLIHRNALKSRIMMGLPIPDYHIVQWAVRAAYTDARNDGTEPVAREMYGARTDTERARAKSDPSLIVTTSHRDPRILWGGEDSDGAWTDIRDDDTTATSEAVDDNLLFQGIWDKVETVMRAKTPEGSHYLDLLGRKATGFSIQELADDEGVPAKRMKALLNKAKRTARASWEIVQAQIQATTEGPEGASVVM